MITAGCRVYLLPNSVGKGRLAIFRDACAKFSLECIAPFDMNNVECVLVEDTLDTQVIIEKILRLDPSNSFIPQLISTRWLSESLRAQQLLPREPFVRSLVVENPSLMHEEHPQNIPKISPIKSANEQSILPRIRSNSDSDYDEDEGVNKTDEELVVRIGNRIRLNHEIDYLPFRN